MKLGVNPRRHRLAGLCRALIGLFVCVAAGVMASAAAAEAARPSLAARVTPEVLATVWPGDVRVGEEEAGTPALPVYNKGGQLLGYVFSTADITRTPGYAGVVFDVVAGIDIDGAITGAKVLYHQEAFIDTRAMQAKLDGFLVSLGGAYQRTKPLLPDAVTGASTSARTMKAAILDSGRSVLRAHSPRPPVTAPTLDLTGFKPMGWDDLLAEGFVASARLSNREAVALVEAAGGAGTKLEAAPVGGPDDVYVETFTGLATPAAIGQNTLGVAIFNTFVAKRPAGSHVLYLSSNGKSWDVLGNAYLRRASNFQFDRFQLRQGDLTLTFGRDQFQRLDLRVPHATDYGGAFVIPADAGFDPLAPWSVDLLLRAVTAAGAPLVVPVPIAYRIPSSLILLPTPPPLPAWLEAWHEARAKVMILAAALGVLTLILSAQAFLSRYRRLHRWVRIGFLSFTLVWLGWTAGAQLSTIHLMNYVLAPFRAFAPTFYLAEPLILILVLYTLGSVVLIGRGVFCGWLCPFGALQELLAGIARTLRLPQWNPPHWLNRRLWLGKYLVAAVVAGVAAFFPSAETAASEAEPFKTAITAMFTRPWPFEVYAGAWLAIGLFTERAYCRFFCPLGGLLAVLDRFHLLDLLKRRPQCGSPCQLCAQSCPVKAIDRTGVIHTAECFQCLDCQVDYYDDQRCPPLVQRRKADLKGGVGTVFTVPRNAAGAA